MMRRSRHGLGNQMLRGSFTETRLPGWFAETSANVHDKRDAHGDRQEYFRTNMLATMHSNLQTDAGPEINPMLRGYRHLHEHYHKLIGRPTSWDGSGPGNGTGLAPYELATDQRYTGLAPPMARLSHYEPHWNRVIGQLVEAGRGSRANMNPATLKVESEARRASRELRQLKTKTDVEAFWKLLDQLITLHGPAVGDYAPARPRNLRHIHEFFVEFHQAISSHKYQDAYLLQHLRETRPERLKDLFGVLMSLECNAISPDYCPRCGLHGSETRHCGESDPGTPFRKYRGTPVPHQHWGREWYDVYANRAEALWYRATNDEFFGDADGGHTQLQVESLLKVYCLTQQRGRANAFMMRLQGSREFVSKRVTITKEMQRMYDELLDTTEHPVLLTNSSSAQPNAAEYLGEGAKGAPQSAKQLRIEYEVMKARRTQREEGVVRVPPQGWKIDAKNVVDYRVGPDGRVTNWRDVKKGLEKSVTSSGLPAQAWTAAERREIRYLEQRIAQRPKAIAAVAKELETERKALQSKGTPFVEFPDSDGIRAFNVSDAALKPFGVAHCQAFVATKRDFLDPTGIRVETMSGRMTLDITEQHCRQFGFAAGTTIEFDVDGVPTEVIVLGVRVDDAPEKWALVGSKAEDPEDIVTLGTDILDVRAKCGAIRIVSTNADPPLPTLAKGNATEEFEGVVIGVRHGVLYAQFDGSSVARPLGRTGVVGPGKQWQMEPSRVPSIPAKLVEPFSWNVPYRNDWSDERLAELQEAPWSREKYAPLTPNRYTPKVKRFGYTQHTTQDDFVTKEYRDRLTSKQVFTDSQKFQLFPDRVAETVYFGGKDESTVVHGVPTVDRRELDEGWDEVPEVPEHEASAVEQAIRDISGRRPGNFSKTASEASSLELTEDWWSSFAHGLAQHQLEDRALHPSRRRRLGETGPFGGQNPPYGTTMGVMERYLEIADDWRRGFDLGPHGMEPGANNAHFDTLGTQSARANALSGDHVLVRLFDSKLAEMRLDLHTFAANHASDANGDIDPRLLITAINEWREQGRPPTLALARVLNSFLADELAAINADLPAGVPPLAVSTSSGVVTATNVPGTATVDQDTVAHRIRYSGSGQGAESALVQEYGYVCAKYVEAATGGLPAEDDVATVLRASYAARFRNALARIVGRGVTPEMQQEFMQSRGEGAKATAPKRLLRSTNLDALLASLGIKHADRDRILTGLYLAISSHGKMSQERKNFVLDADTVLTWRPVSDTRSQSRTAVASEASDGRPSTLTQRSGAAGSSGGRRVASVVGGTTVPVMLESLARNHDGFVMDMHFAARENKRNDAMRSAFTTLMRGADSQHLPDATLDALFDHYCDGRFVPTAETAVQAVANFLLAAADPPAAAKDAVGNRRALDARRMLEINDAGKLVRVLPRPMAETPFKFENVRDTFQSAVEKYREWGLPIGPDSAPAPPLLNVDAAVLDNLEPASPSFCLTFESSGSHMCRLEVGASFGLAGALDELAERNPALKALLGGAAVSEERAVRIANTILQRCIPCTSEWARVVDLYRNRNDDDAKRSTTALRQILLEDADAKVEEAFRNNADRYWREAIEGRGRNTGATTAAGVGVNRSPSPGRGQGQRQDQRQQRPLSPGRGGSPHRQQQQQQGGRSLSPQRGGGQQQGRKTFTSASDLKKGGPSRGGNRDNQQRGGSSPAPRMKPMGMGSSGGRKP